MPSGPGERYDFFLSRRGSVAPIAREVENVLAEKGYKVLVQDYDIPITANFIEGMHEAVKNARDLVVLFTRDYEQSPYTRMEFTSFEANAAQSAEKRRMVILRCEDAPLLGLFAPHVYQDLVGIADAEERRSRILAAAEGRSQASEPPLRPFIGVPPRIASFTGRAKQLDKVDAILMQDKPAAVTQASVGRVAMLGRLPLALDHAAAYCKRTQMRLGDYATKASSLIDAAPRSVGYPRSVAATFDLAIAEAVARCQAAEALMAYLSQCAPERIPMTLVEGAVEGEAERQHALAALAEVSLLNHDPFEDGSPAVTVHRLVQTVARARSEANGSAQDDLSQGRVH